MLTAGKSLALCAEAARVMFAPFVRQAPTDPPRLDAVVLATSSCREVADWIGAVPSASPSFDEAVFLAVMGDLMAASSKHADRGRKNAEVRAALVKVVAAIAVAPDLDGTEGEIFEITEGIRREIYFEVMRFRRAAARDFQGGAFVDE